MKSLEGLLYILIKYSKISFTSVIWMLCRATERFIRLKALLASINKILSICFFSYKDVAHSEVISTTSTTTTIIIITTTNNNNNYAAFFTSIWDLTEYLNKRTGISLALLKKKKKKEKTVIYKTSRYDFQSVQSHPKTFVNLSKFYLTEVFVFDIYVRGDGIRSDYSINLKTIFVEPFSLLHLLRSFDCNWFMIMFSSEKRKQTNKLKVSLSIREIVNVLLSFPKMFLLTPARRTNKTFYKLKHHT